MKAPRARGSTRTTGWFAPRPSLQRRRAPLLFVPDGGPDVSPQRGARRAFTSRPRRRRPPGRQRVGGRDRVRRRRADAPRVDRALGRATPSSARASRLRRRERGVRDVAAVRRALRQRADANLRFAEEGADHVVLLAGPEASRVRLIGMSPADVPRRVEVRFQPPSTYRASAGASITVTEILPFKYGVPKSLAPIVQAAAFHAPRDRANPGRRGLKPRSRRLSVCTRNESKRFVRLRRRSEREAGGPIAS